LFINASDSHIFIISFVNNTKGIMKMKQHSKNVILATAMLASITLSGCVTTNASKTGGSDYRTAETRKAGEVQYGTLMNVRTVSIRENENVENRNASSLGSGGAILGGTLGSGLGDSGSAKGALFGLLAGAIAGAVTANAVGEVEGWEVDVQLPDGKIIVVVQAKKEGETFTSGMKVRVVKYGDVYRVTAV
jgi:outer membrane lipoprotein SlyB